MDDDFDALYSYDDGQERPSVHHDGDRVKRPMNAFMVWSQIERRKMSEAEPRLHNSKISRLLGQRWQLMDDADRLPYVKEAQRLRQIHDKQHPGYKYQPRRKLKSKGASQLHASTVPVPAEVCRRLPFSRNADTDKGLPGGNTTMRYFCTTIGDGSSTGKFTFHNSSLIASDERLPVKLTIDQSFKDTLKTSKSQPKSDNTECSRPTTPSDGYTMFSSQLQRSLVSTPGTDDSGWESTCNSFNSTLSGADSDIFTETSSPVTSFEGITLLGTLCPADADSLCDNSKTLQMTSCLSASCTDATATDLQELVDWDLIDLPSNWQADSTGIMSVDEVSILTLDVDDVIDKELFTSQHLSDDNDFMHFDECM